MSPQHLPSPDIVFCDESLVDGQGELDYIRRQIVRAVMRKDQDKALFTHTRALIKEYIRNKGETGQEFFRKNREYFCMYLANHMLENLFSANYLPAKRTSSGEPVTKSPRFDVFETWMEKLTKLLGFYDAENPNLSISNFVSYISDCLVPVFFLCRRRCKEIAESLVDQICEIVRMDRRALIYHHWDDIFEHWILKTIREPTTHDIDVFLFHWIHKNKVEYFKSKTFRSMFRALLFLSRDEQLVLSLVTQIHRCSSDDETKEITNTASGCGRNDGSSGVDGSGGVFTLSTAIRRYFSNILFQFRNVITMVEIGERSEVATKSLELLLDRVDNELINENAQILLIVLKSAVQTTGELCVPAWLKFVQKLRTNVFVSVAFQVLIFISPLLKFDSAKVLFDEIFVVRLTELSNSTSESVKVLSLLLTMFENKRYKLDQLLPNEVSHKLSSEMPFSIIKSCAKLLFTGMVDLYQMVLEKLLKVLQECDLLQIDSSQLAQALIFALHRGANNMQLRSMIGKCIGIIGLLDLGDRMFYNSSQRIIASAGGGGGGDNDDSDSDDGTTVRNSAEIVSVDNKVQFIVKFIHDIFSKLDECEHAEMAVRLHAVICYILLVPLKAHGMDDQIWKGLSSKVVEALNASRQNPFQVNEQFKIEHIFNKNISIGQHQSHLPIIDQSCNFHQWICCLYCSICDKLEDSLLRTLFASLCCAEHPSIMGKTMCKNIPHVLIQALIEQNALVLDKFEQEAVAVFNVVINGKICWANDAMVAICGIVDVMERFFVCRSAANMEDSLPECKDTLLERFDVFINKILAKNGPPPECLTMMVPLSVLAAQKCDYYFRSLRWLEQFSPANDQGNFRRDFYFLLERLYSHLGNLDAVLGTFQVIRNHTVPEPMDQILALKMQGNYVDALPLCQQLVGQESEMVKCLLRSNQPLLARTFIEHTLRSIDHQQQQQQNDDAIIVEGETPAIFVHCEDFGSKKRRLREYQMEAICKLGDWDQLAILHRNLMTTNDGENGTNLTTPSPIAAVVNGVQRIEKWGAKMASIFCNLRQFDLKGFADGIETVRASLVNAVERTTLEDSSTIAQTQRNISKLRSLYEVESVQSVLYSGGDKPTLLKKTIDDWERQSDSSLSFAGRSERVLSLRAELLRVIDLPNTEHIQCRLLLKCSALARQANYLQRSWAYIAEARALRRATTAGHNKRHEREWEEEDIAVDMEEAKYLFQKGEQFQAVNLFEKAIQTNYAELCTKLNAIDDIGGNGTTRQKNVMAENDDNCSIQLKRKNSFVEAQMLLAEFNERAGAKQMDDLLATYRRLELFGQLSESFYYRYATFYDGYCESVTEITSQMICTLLRLYRNVLEFGPQYVNHAIPRLLSIWLDLAPKCAISEAHASGTGTSAASVRHSANKRGAGKTAAAAAQQFDSNKEMREAFKRLDKAYFFSCFTQMISRITHSDTATYALLKEMLSELVVQFPHRCLWLSQSIARSTRVAVRSKRCTEILELAKKKARNNNSTGIDLNLLIQQYDYLATLLIGIAETKIDQHRVTGLSVARFFPNIVAFFENSTMRSGGVGTRGTAANRLTPLGKQQQSLTSCSSSAATNRPQILLPFIDDNMDMHCSPRSTITASQIRGDLYIHGVGPTFDCLKSLEAPKKMAFIGTDGRTYPLLCKQNDDLCKDARFMDVNRMLNTLFKRDSDTRNQLYIRCYSVIPLKEAGGGIIQWVPNLVPFADALKNFMQKKYSPLSFSEMQRILGEQSTDVRVKAFREKICVRHPLAMAHWQRTTFLDACSWYNARLAFTRTAATMSMVGFLLGLGDRHGQNILLDVKTGGPKFGHKCLDFGREMSDQRTIYLIHVDFNILFDKGECLKVPEIVPFRLTRNMVDGFGATGVEGTFRKSCEKALKVMRAESRMLGTVLHAFAHDPLLEWTTTEARNQQYRQYGGTALQSQDSASITIGMLKMRLAGHIVTARFNPPKACAVPMSVGGQVARLIEIATDDAKLSAMYVGWSAYI